MVQIAVPKLKGEKTLILYGDVPLVDIGNLKKLIEIGHQSFKVKVGGLTIVREADSIEAIVEEKDCNDIQKKITEITSFEVEDKFFN